LQRQNSELRAMRDTLELRVEERTQALLAAEKMAIIGRLTAGIAHEMASPLSAVLSAVDGLKDLAREYRESIGDAHVTKEDHLAIADEMCDAMNVAELAAQRSAKFVRSIKSQSRIAVASKREEFDVVALVHDCVSLLSHAARRSNCRVETRFSAPQLRAWGSPTRLSQAVTNLVQNAIDATGERRTPIDVDVAATASGALRIVVRDRGEGIRPEVVPRIFEPLFTTKPFGQGTGLGLAIVKDVVERELGGTIAVSTVLGAGSTFTIELPNACVEATKGDAA
jgi:signal transduction histidine kinase